MPKFKQPKVAVTIAGNGKSPRVESSAFVSPNQRSPVWRLSLLDLDGPWGWRNIDAAAFFQIHARLADCEKTTWHQLGLAGSHPIPKGDIIRAAQLRLQEIGQDDIDEIYSLRFTGRQRLWGIREEHVFKALWWDPEHEVCPSYKKHT